MKFDDIPILESTQKRDPVSWGDWARAGGVGALRMVDVAPSLAQYLSGSGNDPYTLSAAMKRATGELADSLYEGMGEEAQRLAGARWLPDPDAPDVWDGDVSLPQALALQTIMSIPSLAVSVGATLAGGPAAGSAAVGAMYTASAYEDAVEALKDAPPEEFAENDYYQELLKQGYSHEDARFETIQYAIGVKPLVAGLLSAGLARGIGVEGLLGRFRSMPRTRAAAAGFVGEGSAEMAQEGVTASAVEAARFAAIGKDPRFYEIAQRAVAGGAVGAPLGAGIGAVAGGRRDRAPQQQEQEQGQQDTGVDPDQQLALSDGQADLFGGTNTRRAPVAEPEATPEPRDPNQADLFGDADQDSTSTDAGDPDVDLDVVRQRARAPRRAAPTVTAPGAPAPDQAAALTAANAQIEAARQQAQTSGEQIPQITPVAPTAQAPLQPPVSAAGITGTAPTIDTAPVAQPAPALPPEVTPAPRNEVVEFPEGMVGATSDIATGRRVLVPPLPNNKRELAAIPKRQARVQQNATKLAVQTAVEVADGNPDAAKAIARIANAARMVAARSGPTQKREAAARKALDNENAPQAEELAYAEGNPTPDLYNKTKTRIDAMTSAADKAGAKIPAKAGPGTTDTVAFLSRARKISAQIAAGKPPSAAEMAEFINDEAIVRSGDAETARANKRVKDNMRGSGDKGGEDAGAGSASDRDRLTDNRTPEEIRDDAARQALDDADLAVFERQQEKEANDRRIRQALIEKRNKGRAKPEDVEGYRGQGFRVEPVLGPDGERIGSRAVAVKEEMYDDIPEAVLDRSAIRRKLPRKKVSPAVAKVQENVARKKLSIARTAEAQAVVQGETAQARTAEAEVAAPPPTPFERFTAAFKRWFGDSKVVDENGNPLVMYHGSEKDFAAFQPGRIAIFASPDPAFAASYAALDGGSIYPVYVKAENPFDFRIEAQRKAVFDKMAELYPDKYGENERRVWQEKLRRGQYPTLEAQSVQAAIKALGHDSFYVGEGGNTRLDDRGVINIAVFEPTQIKSAIGNKGTYDPTNPSIVASVSQREKTVSREEFKQLLQSGNIRPASLDDVQGTHHKRALYKHPNTGQWYVAKPAASVRARDTRGLITTPAGRNSAANVRANPQSVAKGKPMTLGARLLPLIGANPGGIQGEIWRRMVGDLRKIVSDVPVYVTDDAGMLAATADMLESGQLEGIADGFYDPTNNIIMLNQAALADPVNRGNLILHEATHAALHNLIETNAAVRSDLEAILSEAQTAYDGLTELAGQRAERPYGLSSVHELVSEALSNPDFQNTLMNLSASPELAARLGLEQQRPSLWNTLVELVRKHVFGNADGPPTLFEAVLRATEKTMAIRMQQGVVAGQGAPVASMGGRTVGNFVARVKRGGFALQLTNLEGLRERAMARWGEVNRPFTEAAQKVADALLSVTNRRRELAEPGNRLVTELAQLTKADPEGYRDYDRVNRELVRNDTVVLNQPNASLDDLLKANRHVSQKRRSDKIKLQRMQDLQREFMALPADFRAMHVRLQKYYAAKAEDTAKSLIDTALATADLTDAQRADIRERTFNRKLNKDEDRKLLGDILYRQLARSALYHKPQGTYSPAMRFGRWRVSALLKAGDLMGGKLVRDGRQEIVEFTGPTDKEAWAKAEAWMKSRSGDELYDNGRPSRIFFERKTGEQLEAADALRMDDADIEVRIRMPIQRDFFMSFDNFGDARNFIADSRNEFEKIVDEPLDGTKNNLAGELQHSQLGAMLSEVRNSNLNQEAKDAAELAIFQASLKLTSGVRHQQRAIASRKVRGASADMVRVLFSYNDAYAGFATRREVMPVVDEAFRELQRINKAEPFEGDRVDRDAFVSELGSRFQQVRNYQEPNQIISDLLTVSFLNYLASPGYSIINATQVAMVAYPELAGTYGPVRAAAQIVKAYNTVGGLSTTGRGLANTVAAARQWGELVAETDSPLAAVRVMVGKAEDGKRLLAVLDFLERVGLLDIDAGFEVGQEVSAGRGALGKALLKTTRIARQLPTAVEVMNRAVTGVATYRLAYDANASKPPAERHKLAMEAARTVTAKTQGNYSHENAPGLFKANNLLRVATQFQKFPQLMAQYMLMRAHTAFKGASQAERMEAVRQLGYLAGMQVAVGGAIGLPMLELAKMPVMLAGLLGAGEGWEPIEHWMQDVVSEVTNSEAFGEALMRGLLTRPLGIDVSSRINLANLAVGFGTGGYDRDSVHAYIATRVLGAPGTLITTTIDGIRDIRDGNWARGFPKVVPIKVVSDSLKALSDDKLNVAENVMLGSGIQPGQRARRWEEMGRDRIERQRRDKEKTRLINRWRSAAPAARRVLRREIERYNRDAGYRDRIFPWNWSE